VTDTSTPECGSHISDMYSAMCWAADGSDQCGTPKKEGECYNREHSWPKSWWGGAQNAAYTDLFHLFPTDGYDNSRRNNYVLGPVSTAKYTTSNGCRLGTCESGIGFTGTCWEPVDQNKGMMARVYFYMSTAYRGVFTCCDDDGVNGALIKPWLQTLLKQWHDEYPPFADEIQRNEIIYNEFQGNRNPFIDYPEWAYKIDFSE